MLFNSAMERGAGIRYALPRGGQQSKRYCDRTIVYPYQHNGITAVSNIWDVLNWTSHYLAKSNLYGYGRLLWNPELTAEEIGEEWTRMTFGLDPAVTKTVVDILMESWPGLRELYLPAWRRLDGRAACSLWPRRGRLRIADRDGIGVDRTQATETGDSGQYIGANAAMYERLETWARLNCCYFSTMSLNTHVLSQATRSFSIFMSLILKGRAGGAVARTLGCLEPRLGRQPILHVKQQLLE